MNAKEKGARFAITVTVLTGIIGSLIGVVGLILSGYAIRAQDNATETQRFGLKVLSSYSTVSKITA